MDRRCVGKGRSIEGGASSLCRAEMSPLRLEGGRTHRRGCRWVSCHTILRLLLPVEYVWNTGKSTARTVHTQPVCSESQQNKGLTGLSTM